MVIFSTNINEICTYVCNTTCWTIPYTLMNDLPIHVYYNLVVAYISALTSPFIKFQILISRSKAPLIIRVSSKCKQLTAASWPWKVSLQSPSGRDHICIPEHSIYLSMLTAMFTLIVLSFEPDTTLCPSNCKHKTASVWPLNYRKIQNFEPLNLLIYLSVLWHCPVLMSQIFKVWSYDPLITTSSSA